MKVGYDYLIINTVKAATQETQNLAGEFKMKLPETVGIQTGLNCLWNLVLYIFRATVLHIQVYSQLIAQLVLLLLHVSTAKHSHLHVGRHVQRAIQVVKYK
jgi:hypothetical protein